MATGSPKRDCLVPERAKLHLAMLFLQFCFAGFHIVSRAALNMGISKVVFAVYRNTIALLLLTPFAYFLEKKERPPLTFSLLVQFFLLGLCGITINQGFYLLGLYYTSPTFASAAQNAAPAFTFVMAAALRLEQVNIMKKEGLAKVLGTIACIAGATIMTLYKGPPLLQHHLHQLADKALGQGFFSSLKIEKWKLGCVYLFGNCTAWSGWIVLQAPVLRKYPARLSLTSFTCFFGIIQLLIIAAFVERDSGHWTIHSREELLTILYAGLVASGIAFAIQTWCIDRGGPLFVGVYQPVQTVVVAIMESAVLGDKLYTGGLIGVIFIVVGLYAVLWGKSRENGMVGNTEKEGISTTTQPLLAEEKSQSNNAVSSDFP